MATELTVEAVRDFIIFHDGKVKNNSLVTHFRKFLNDPSRKVESRQIFKDCVNEVAVVKTENGEKYVQLKKKYRTGAPLKVPDSPIETRSPDSLIHSPTQDQLVSSFDAPLTHQQRRPTGSSVPREQPPPYTEHDRPPPYQPMQNTPPKKQTTSSKPHPEKSPPKTILSQRDSTPMQVDPTVSLPSDPTKQTKRTSIESNVGHRQPQMDSSGTFKMPYPPGSERKSGMDGAPKRMSHTNLSDARLSNAGSQGSLDRVRSTITSNNDDNISIMQSEASIDSNLNNDFDDDRGGSTFAMDPLEKQWMIMCARGSMLELRKLLNTDPNLVEKRDFVFGYTGLHWAAKKGSEDLVRMLADTGIDVNIISNGGYTPMHLAAMHGHEKVVQVLLEEYQADPLIRNYSGKQARDYLKSGSISLPMQRLMFGNDGNIALRDFAAGLRPRLDSVRKSKRLGNAISGGVGVLVGTLVRGKAVSTEDVSSTSSNSPHVARKGSFSMKGKKKKKRKNSKDERPSISLVSPSDDSEFGFGPRSNSVVGELQRHGKSSPIQTKQRSRGDSVIPKSGSYDGFGSYR